MGTIIQQLEDARKKLLDLTMRNRLLNFIETRTGTIRVINEIPSEVFKILVLDERAMEFLSKEEEEEELDLESDEIVMVDEDEDSAPTPDDQILLEDNVDNVIWQLHETDEVQHDKYTDRFLQTNLESKHLQKRLFYMNQKSRSLIEERGYTVLYLALGFLEWIESPDAIKKRYSPLVLIPVELERKKVGSLYKLRWTGEDLSTNISLQAKLMEQGIKLPEFETPEEKQGIDDYFKAVESAVAPLKNWSINQNIYLGFFSFTKFIMYRDLNPEIWPEEQSPAIHPLIKSILEPTGEEIGEDGFKESEVDEKLSPRDCYHVMDADPSQIVVIEDAKNGKNLVVEGPPGTGKSQTITNIIGELLAQNKTVLFVSEKMAALEVVKKRLDSVGLGNYCLELHSHKAKKKEFLEELKRTVNSRPLQDTSSEEKFEELIGLKRYLNEYTKAMNEPFGQIRMNPIDLINLKQKAISNLKDSEQANKAMALDLTETVTYEEYLEAKASLANISDVLSSIGQVSLNPWKACSISKVLPKDEYDILNSIYKLITLVDKILNQIQLVSEKYAIRTNQQVDLEEIGKVLDGLDILAEAYTVDRDLLSSNVWDKPNEDALQLITNLHDYNYYKNEVEATYRNTNFDFNNCTIIAEFEERTQKVFRIFNKRYRELKSQIQGFYSDNPPKKLSVLLQDLKQLNNFLLIRNELNKSENTANSIFGKLWEGENTDAELLEGFSEWIVEFRGAFINGDFNEAVINKVASGINSEEIDEHISKIEKELAEFEELRNALFERLQVDLSKIEVESLEKWALTDFLSLLNHWKDGIAKLQPWTQYIITRNKCAETLANPIIQLIESEDSPRPVDLVHIFNINFADALLGHIFSQRAVLANFVPSVHESKIKRFRNLDQEIILANRGRLANLIHRNQPQLLGGASPNSESGILQGEFARKRGHMPIRKLMSHCGNLIQKIKPCFMMSPLSVALFCDPQKTKFDVIIFDEASQIRPEESLGALLRGSQLIVMGDTRQLPPTSFFDHLIESEDNGDEEVITALIGEMESLLHQCKRSFPIKTLTWHYRSKHESLIAVSNHQFYDNRLLFYPSPTTDLDQLGLKHVHLPDTVYDRGRSGANRGEARYVAEKVIEHFREYPKKSLGIGTFNIRQQHAILEEIEEQLYKYPEMEEYLSSNRHEHFFVKNLETIQGDERDVIFISVGFGFDINHRLSKNFGPINQDGGERRLNVLITRARERCVVFSNFRAKDLGIEHDAPFGLRALKVFLQFAETKELVADATVKEDPDSPFEESVYKFLKDNNIQVEKQVGCAGFRVDLAVVSTKFPNRYALGIECDGAKYHSSPVARDRDRLRQQILESRGWEIYRIWSTDWYRSRHEAENRLLEKVKSVLEQGKERVEIPRQITDSIEPEVFESAKIFEEVDDLNSDGSIIDEIPLYETCETLPFNPYWELHETYTSSLAKCILMVVEKEAPVHLDEVVRRIRTLWGLKRAGQRIYNAIEDAANYAKRKGMIEKKGKFLWMPDQVDTPVRRRHKDPPPNIELICDEEIGEAIKYILRTQYATKLDELVVQTARILGIKSTRSNVEKRIRAVMGWLLNSSIVETDSEGKIKINQEYQ